MSNRLSLVIALAALTVGCDNADLAQLRQQLNPPKHPAPALVQIDGPGTASEVAIACQGAVDVSQSQSGETTYTVEWVDAHGVKHTVYGARRVVVTQLKPDEARQYCH